MNLRACVAAHLSTEYDKPMKIADFFGAATRLGGIVVDTNRIHV